MPTPVGTDGSEYRGLQIVNIVASGTLDVGEVDVDTLAEDLAVVKTALPGRIYLQENEKSPIAMVFRSGTYTIAGAASWQEIQDTTEWLSQVLNAVGLDPDREPILASLEVKYLVVTGELDSSINLSAAAITLGMERTEYEPEQFPGLFHRPEGAACTVLVFSNGKLTVTGVQDVELAHRVFLDIQESLTGVSTE